MTDLTSAIRKHRDMPIDEQKKAGRALAGSMRDEHAAFLKKIVDMLDRNQIDTWNPPSLLKKDVYDKLTPEWKSKVDAVLVNVVSQLRNIENFYRSKQTPDSSPHLEAMIEHLWQMKQRIEEHHDAFVI